MKKISETQSKVLNCIVEWVKIHDYPPTLRELSKLTGLKSTWTIRYHLNNLQASGYLKLKKGLSRGIVLLNNVFSIPVLGNISAGKPVDAVENIEGYVDLSNMFKDQKDMFALRIKGDSMTDAGIFEGDIAFIKKQASAQDGDIVAALIGTEALVKTFFLTKSGVKLVPANAKYQPIITKDAQIIGKVVGIVRKYANVR